MNMQNKNNDDDDDDGDERKASEEKIICSVCIFMNTYKWTIMRGKRAYVLTVRFYV